MDERLTCTHCPICGKELINLGDPPALIGTGAVNARLNLILLWTRNKK